MLIIKLLLKAKCMAIRCGDKLNNKKAMINIKWILQKNPSLTNESHKSL